MSEIEIEQMQEKIDAGILLAQQRLKERVKKEDGELVIMRDGKKAGELGGEFGADTQSEILKIIAGEGASA